MACNQCTPCTNCTPPTPVSTSCEECADIISSSCVYYKGAYGNNLGLAANFRFNTFAEKVMQRFSDLPGSLTGTNYEVTSLAANLVSVNQYHFEIEQTNNSNTPINEDLDLRPYFAIVKLNSTNNIAITSNSGAEIPFYSIIDNNKHIVDLNTNRVTPETNLSNAPRTGYQKLSGTISFSSNAAGVATVQIKKGSTVLSQAKATVSQNGFVTISLSAYDNYNTFVNANYHMYLFFDDTASAYNTTIDVLDGTFEVKEYGYS